jgi:type IV pilus assembly protein PilK
MAWIYQVQPDLSDEQFERWQQVLEDKTGICFVNHKSILQTGLLRRMREIGCNDYEQYYRQVRYGTGSAIEWTALLNSITVRETSFFRHREAFDYVKRYLFNRLLSGRAASGNSVEMWSVGCSTGEEAYSLAMIANDCIEGMKLDSYFGVTGSDICLQALSEARRGEYGPRKLEKVEPAVLDRYFEETGAGARRVVPWLKQRVCFVQSNVIDMQGIAVDDLDVIYCQNMLVYFRRPRQKQVLDSLAQRLKPGGLLVVGLGEAVDWTNPLVRRVPQESIQAYVRV